MNIDEATRAMIRTASDEAAASQGCRFDLARAERVRTFFRQFLRHSKGAKWAGQPFELLPWQWDNVIAPLYGWIRPDGSRRFRIALIEVAKKNGKSTLASGLGLYHLIGDGEPGAEVFSAAVTREQASIVHAEAINMVEASPGLSSYLRVNKSTWAIHFAKTKSFYRTLAHDADSAEGKNASAIIADEIHAWKAKHGRDFYRSIQFAGVGRDQPMFFQITTAGNDVSTVAYEKIEYGRKVLRGELIDTRFFAYICEPDEDDDPKDPATWYKANPSLGSTMKEEDFAADLQEAERSPTDWPAFLQRRLNLWSTGTSPALRLEDWKACRSNFTEADLAGRECWGGLDLSRVRDMTAFPLIFPGDAEDEWLLLVWFWLCHGSLHSPTAPAELLAWAKQGWIKETPGDVTDYRIVEDDIVEICSRYNVREIGYDPLYAEEITQRIDERTGVKRVAFGQTVVNFAGPTAEFERLVIAHKLHHNGNPVLTWQAGNVEFATDRNNNKRPVKPGDREVKKIDGIVAAIMALGRGMLERGLAGECGCG